MVKSNLIFQQVSGFHRLDFIIQQYAKPTTLNQTKETFCTEDIDHLTYLSN